MQKESSQDRKLSELAVSAAEQIHQRVEKILEPKLDLLLSKKVKVNALKTKPNKKRAALQTQKQYKKAIHKKRASN